MARVVGDPPTIQAGLMEFGKAEMESNLLNGNYWNRGSDRNPSVIQVQLDHNLCLSCDL